MSKEELLKSSAVLSLYDKDGLKISDFKISKDEFFADYDNWNHFWGDYFAFPEEKDSKKCYGLRNEKGEWVVKPSKKVKGIMAVKDNMFIYSDGESFGLMDFDGNVVLRPKYKVLYFSGEEGVFFVQKGDEEWILINQQGEQIGKDTYQDVRSSFVAGYALVSARENDIIFINTEGEEKKST